MKSAPTRVSIVLLCGVFALCLYRAATQAFTIDESFTFLHYIDTPWRDVFGDFSSNNHVLFSLFSRIFRYRFGRSEIVLRIPALIGCVLFELASFRICRRAIGDRWLLPLALAVLTLNPLVLDFMVAARGYGLGLGLFWWALDLLSSDKSWGAGVAAGLSIATNMIFLVPLAALGAVAIPIYARKDRFWDLVQSYALPAIVISFVILVIPISKSAGQFYYGATTLARHRQQSCKRIGRRCASVCRFENRTDRVLPRNDIGHLAARPAQRRSACVRDRLHGTIRPGLGGNAPYSRLSLST